VWACLLGKNGAFLETLETRFLAITWVSGTLQYAPNAYPVKFYNLECWGWAVVGIDSWGESKSMHYSHRSQTFVSMGPANSVPNTLKVCEATPADLPQLFQRVSQHSSMFYNYESLQKLVCPDLGCALFS
jgi:hypothetical protein